MQSLVSRYRRPLTIVFIFAGLGLLALYIFVDPSSGFYPRCIVKSLTGLSCPGCGTQRAVHALLHGNFSDILRFNALLLLEIPILGLLFLAALPLKISPSLNRILSSRIFIISLLLIIIFWTIIRNIFDI